MKDALGNEIRVGGLVALQLERPLVWGRVEKIEEGGIVHGINKQGQAEVRPGRVIISTRHVVGVDPRVPVASVLSLREDEAEQEPTPEVSPLAN